MAIKLSLNNTASAVKQNNLSNGKGKIKLSLGATETNAGGLGGGLKYLGSNLGAGAFGVLEGAYDFTVGGIADLFGADEYAKKLQENDISGQWQQKAAEKFNPSKGWEFAGQVASGVGQSAVGIGAAVLTGGSSLAAGATIGLGAAGKSTTAAYQQTGELGLKEYAYGAASGIIEGSLEALTGAAGKIGKRIASPTAKTLAKSTVRQGIVKTMLTEGAGEFVEEALSEYIDPYLLRATKINPEAENATAQEIVYAGMVGFVSGAILSGTTSTASNVSNISRGNKITAEGKTSTLLAKATELKEYTDTAIAESADSNLVATPLKQLTASVNAYDKLKNKDSLKGKMLLGEIQQGVAYVEMSQGVQTSLVNVKANAEALAQTEYFKNTYKDYTAADITANKDDIATKLAISDFAGKMLIPTEQYTAQIQAGQMAQGETQYNAWRESIDDKTAESVSKQLGIDIKTASYYEATKAVEDYNKSGKNIPTLPDKISLKVGDSTIYRLSDGRTVGIKRDKKGYYVAVNDANGKGIGKNNKAIAKNDIDDFIATLTAPKAVQKEQKALSDTEAENTTKTETATTEPQSETVQPLKKAQTASATVTARKYVKNFDMLDAATRGRIVEAIISGTQYGVNSTTLNAVANLLSVRKGLNISFSNIEANGLYTTVKKERFAVINPKLSDNMLRETILHELTHDLERTIGYTALQTTAVELADKADKKRITEQYTKYYEDNDLVKSASLIDEEITAHFFSQFMGQSDFISKYANEQSSTFQKAKKWISNLAERLKNINNQAYRAAKQLENLYTSVVATKAENVDEDIRYSLTRDTMMTKMPESAASTRTEKMFKGWTNFQIAFVNEQAGVENALKAVGVKNGEALTNFVRSANKAGEEMLAGNQYSASGKYQGEGLSKIFAPVLAKGEAYEQSFYDYLANYHNIDRLKQGKPVNAATAEQSNDIIESYDQTNPEFKAIAEKLWQYNRNLLQYRVDTGLITKELANSLNEMYPHYIPTFRNKDSQIGTGSLKGKFNIAVKSTIKTAKGSTSEILPIGVMMARQTLETIKAGRVNTLAKTLNDAAATSKYDGVEVMNKQALTIENTEDADYTENKPNANKNEITFFDNGQRVTMRVSKDIFAGFNAFSPAPKVDNIVFKGLRKVNATFKRLVTSLNPAFLVRNTVRDLQDAGLYTKYGTAFIGNYKEAINQIKTDGEYWKLYRAMGGFTSSVFDFEKGFVGAQNRFGLTKAEGNVLSKGLTALENANAFVEQLPRLAEFMSSIQAGNSVEQALLDSADITVNFGRSGNITKKLNSTIMPFLNPAIQGFDKIIRTLTGARTKKAITSLIIKAAVVGILPQLLNQLMYDDDEDYALLRDTDKENNYLFKIGDKFIKIPKGRVVSVFSGLVNRVSQTAKGEEYVWEGYGKNVLSQITPVDNLSRTVLSPFSDVKNNLTWYGTAIEGREFEAIEPKNRYDEKTSIIAIALGKVLNYSPKKIHYLLDQYSGVIGDFILPATTSAAEKDFLSGNFTIDPVNSNRLSNKFYKLYDETNYAKSNGDTTAAYKMRYLNKIKSAVSELYNEKSAIQASNLTDKEKIAETKTIQTLINEAYKTALADIELMGKAIEATEGIDENLRYTEATRLMYGAERALREYDKSVYAKAQSMNAAGIDYDTYYLYYFGTKTLTAETNANGDTINGSKKTNVLKYIASLKIPTVQKYLLVLNSGYVINDGDIKNVSKKQAYLTVAEYIAKLKISTSDKAELAERLGLTVKNNKIIV